MRDVTKSHEQADPLRGFVPVGQYEAIYFDAQLNKHRPVGEILDYFTSNRGLPMIKVQRGGLYKYIAVANVMLVAPGI